MSDKEKKEKKKGGKGKVVAIVAIIIVVLGLVAFFVMGAIKKSHERPGGPGQGGPGMGPGPGGREGGSIESVYDVAAEDFYIAA